MAKCALCPSCCVTISDSSCRAWESSYRSSQPTILTRSPKPLQELGEDEAVSIALRALDTAAESDTATGGVDRSGEIYPLIKIVSREGITTLPESKIADVFKETVA